MSWVGWRLGDALRVWDSACRSDPPGCVDALGSLCGPAIWPDPVAAKQLPQALDLAVQVLVLLDDRGKIHPGRPCPLLRCHMRQQASLLIAQPRRLLEIPRSMAAIFSRRTWASCSSASRSSSGTVMRTSRVRAPAGSATTSPPG
jgi:hypothetical protein